MREQKVVDSDCGYEATTPLDAWRSLFEAWHSILDRYGMLYPEEDVAYWYNERATLSTFVGAIWNCDGIALEEYRCDRVLSGRPAKGRADLWFRTSAPAVEYLVEAKQGWPRTSNALPILADELLDEAIAQLDSDTLVTVSKVALVFLAPRFSTAPETDSLHTLVSMARSVQHDALAWYFPETARTLRSRVTQAWYPGVIAVARALPPAAPR